MQKEILISGMTCGHCVKRVENALFEIDGVHSVVVSLEDKRATIEAEGNVEDQLIKDAIDDIGYTVEAIQ